MKRSDKLFNLFVYSVTLISLTLLIQKIATQGLDCLITIYK